MSVHKKIPGVLDSARDRSPVAHHDSSTLLSIFTYAMTDSRRRSSRHTQGASLTLRTPPNRHLPPSNPLRAPLGQMLALGNQTLMNRTSQHRDAVPADLVAEVLTGDADSARAGRAQDIHIQVVPLLRRGRRASSGHHKRASTPVLLAIHGGVKRQGDPWRSNCRQTGVLPWC